MKLKQHITKKQLHELAGKQGEELYKWCDKRGYLISGVKESGTENSGHQTIPLLSIGQMIHFLIEEGSNEIGIKFHCDFVSWQVLRGNGVFVEEGNLCYFQDELVDALWTAVKGVLEQ